MSAAIPGASVWEQALYDHIMGHLDSEREVIRSYDALAQSTDSPGFAYLARLILDDERRHHQQLRDLADTVKSSAELSNAPTPIPDLAMWGVDRGRILAETERYLAIEKDDNKELEALIEELRDVRKTTVWHLVVRLIQIDNEKHQTILRFVRDCARDPRWQTA